MKTIYSMLIVTTCLLTPIYSIAEDPGNIPPQPLDTPIDGGLSLLLAAGIAYGAKKGYDKRKKEKKEVLSEIK